MMPAMRPAAALTLALTLVLATVPIAGQSFDTWTAYLGGIHSSQYSSLSQINRSNVSTLKVAWTYSTGPGSFRFNPLIIGNVMYVAGANNSVVALDAAT